MKSKQTPSCAQLAHNLVGAGSNIALTFGRLTAWLSPAKRPMGCIENVAITGLDKQILVDNWHQEPCGASAGPDHLLCETIGVQSCYM